MILGLHQYTYVQNNPVNLTDPFGLKPGDKYPTQDAAAIAASNDINNTSISEGKEYAGWIYRNDDGTYSYTAPNAGTKDGSDPGAQPDGGTAYYHTHGANDPGYDNENFSDADTNFADKKGVDGYVATPGGDIKKYDHDTKTGSNIGSTNPGGGGGGTGGAGGGGGGGAGGGGPGGGGGGSGGGGAGPGGGGPGGGGPCPCGGSG
jgi:hypothetical protein